jgi:hypothetical protein
LASKAPPKPATSKNGGKPTFEDTVEAAIRRQLAQKVAGPSKNGDTGPQDGVTFDEMSRAVANAIRWAAVKARLTLPEHGSGWEEESDG